MVTALRPRPCLLWILIVVLGLPASAYQIVPAKTAITIEIPAPALITECMARVWIYSKIKRTFYVINPSDGRVVTTLPLTNAPAHDHVTALACHQEHLLVGLVLPNKIVALGKVVLSPGPELEWQTSLAVPSRSRLSDLDCRQNLCGALADGSLYLSADLKNWQREPIPPTPAIPHQDVDISTNPFDDWPEKMLISKGLPSRLVLHKRDEIFLLDPFRSNVMEWNGRWAKRWGDWGVWEGKFLNPKSLARDNSGTLYISDPALKAIFAFDKQGGYRGSLGWEKKLLDLKYPLRLLYSSGKLWVADFLADKAFAFEVAGFPSAATADSQKVFRENLFRRPEVLQDRLRNRCLNCHDGTVTDATEHFLPQLTHHPVEVKVEEKTDLPLTERSLIGCATCHDPHHGAGTKKPTASPFLRKDPLPLCLSCHQEKQDSHRNHKDGKSNSCLACHTPHSGVGKIQKQAMPMLCISCHKDQRFEHRSIENVLQTSRAEGLEHFGSKISCNTCHAPHLKESSKALLKKSESLTRFCSSCHGAKTDRLLEGFHKIMKAGGRK